MPERTLTPKQVSQLANDLRLACMRISRRVRFESDAELAPHQFSVLARLDGAERTPAELAAIERVSAPSMTRTTSCLVELGLIARTPDPNDGRQVILSLTPAGRTTLGRVREQRDAWMIERFASLSPEDLRALNVAASILAKVASE